MFINCGILILRLCKPQKSLNVVVQDDLRRLRYYTNTAKYKSFTHNAQNSKQHHQKGLKLFFTAVTVFFSGSMISTSEFSAEEGFWGNSSKLSVEETV